MQPFYVFPSSNKVTVSISEKKKDKSYYMFSYSSRGFLLHLSLRDKLHVNLLKEELQTFIYFLAWQKP